MNSLIVTDASISAYTAPTSNRGDYHVLNAALTSRLSGLPRKPALPRWREALGCVYTTSFSRIA
jgi:hypothetical protein